MDGEDSAKINRLADMQRIRGKQKNTSTYLNTH